MTRSGSLICGLVGGFQCDMMGCGDFCETNCL